MPKTSIEAVAMGTGPSAMLWIKAGSYPAVPRYGCSWIPHFLKLNAYAIGDICHFPDVPTDGTRIAATACVRKEGHPEWELYQEMLYPHGSQSGGMAISMACREYRRVGLVGFDGGMDEPYETDLRKMLEWWKARGRTFVSLMPKSTFDDLMEKT
jgi:hypothetical protein